MAIRWNEEQAEVIRHREGNLLVSAAAGSGKTAVMIERLVQMIEDAEDPVDVDRLLVVTFTNAAAAQMRDKLHAKLSEACETEEDPILRTRLIRQLKGLKSASIMTLHSFCLQCIRSYVTRIQGLDPGFRVADETEAELLKADTLDEVLEACYQYASQNPETEEARQFLSLADRYSGARQDMRLEELVLQMEGFLSSLVAPDAWLADAASAYNRSDVQELKSSPWFPELARTRERGLHKALGLYDELISAYEKAGYEGKIVSGLQEVLEALKEDPVRADKVSSLLGYRMDYKPWKGDDDGKKRVETLAKKAKEAAKTVLSLEDEWLKEDEARLLKEDIYPALLGLQWVIQRFDEAYRQAKQDRNLVDFSDLERYALQILTGDDGMPSQEAEEIREQYRYICVDEYQDSNDIQEAVLSSIAKKDSDGNPINIFMVGDVKQSIYKFREARPELFLDKQASYPQTQGAQVLYLHRNYRSRAEVLSAVNDLFYKLMYRPDGEIEYSEQEALVPGRTFPAESPDKLLQGPAELCLLEQPQGAGSYEKRQHEAEWIAKRIQNLMLSGALICDEETETGFRPVRYRDFVILLRAPKIMAPVLKDALAKYAVPSYSEITAGFYQTKEIQCVVNLLRIIDNPLQDIPLAGVLYSPIFSFTGQELAAIRRATGREILLYDSLLQYADGGQDSHLRVKIVDFLALLKDWRERVRYMRIHELIWHILQQTGYYVCISGTPNGTMRRANLDLLLSRALEYENGSYSGLFHFLRYIEKMEEQERDEAQAVIAGEEDNVVRIMSIHKSKGLEFPIVLLCDADHGFNMMDLNQPVLLHPQLGIGAKAIDADGSFRYSTFPYRAIRERKRQELLAEEMRVLYVAMTRAQQKLYVVGYAEDTGDAEPLSGRLPSYQVSGASSYMDWLLPITAGVSTWKTTRYALETEEPQEIQDTLVVEEEEEDDAALYEKLNRDLLWQYAYRWKEQLPVRLSVSQLKQSTEKTLIVADTLDPDGEDTPNQSDKRSPSGAEAGTAIHKVFSLLDLASGRPADEQMYTLMQRGLLHDEERALVSTEQVQRFLDSPLAGRMRKSPRMLREQPFILTVPIPTLREMVPGWMEYLPEAAEEESIMIQGIIDACFLEDQAWVIVDYKSDRFLDEERMERYSRQLNLYAYALETITAQPVRELLLYPTRTGATVPITRG